MTTRHTIPDPDQVGQFYDRISDLLAELWGGNIHFGYWLDDRDHCTFQEAAERMTDELVQRLNPRPDQLVLDVGCGVGTPLLRLAHARGVRAVGISVSRHQIARATERVHAAGLADRVRFEYADAMALPFPDASFDAAWAVESLLHVSDRSQGLREAARVLRPGGRLVIADLLPPEIADGEQKAVIEEFCASNQIVSLIGIADYRTAVVQAGLIPVEVSDVSAHTCGSLSAMRIEMLTHHRDFIRVLGPELFERMSSARERMGALPEIGYVLLTARKP